LNIMHKRTESHATPMLQSCLRPVASPVMQIIHPQSAISTAAGHPARRVRAAVRVHGGGHAAIAMNRRCAYTQLRGGVSFR
jgi:hypothetical protein